MLSSRSRNLSTRLPRHEAKDDAYVNKAAFINPTGTFGNAGRNSLNVPGGWTADLSVQKRIPIYEEVALGLRADFYNAFNHTRLNGGIFNGRSSLYPVSSPSFRSFDDDTKRPHHPVQNSVVFDLIIRHPTKTGLQTAERVSLQALPWVIHR